MKTNLLSIVVVVLATFFTGNAQAKTSDAAAIRYAKATLVSKIETGMPGQRLDTWLKKAAGRNAKLTWEVNDCGEQTGTAADKGRDFPMCVEANAESGDMAIVLGIHVGSFMRGIQGRPQLRFAQLHFEGEEHQVVNRLKDLVPAIKKATRDQ